MSTAIPAFVCGLRVDANSDGVHVDPTGAGTLQLLSQARWYYPVSPRTATNNGQSLLQALKAALDASSVPIGGSPTWTPQIDAATFRFKLVHTHGTTLTVRLDGVLAHRLGIAVTEPIPATFDFGVPNGAGGGVAPYPMRWWWSPDRHVSRTGPEWFSVANNVGIPRAASHSQRSSDGTRSYTNNGVLYDAIYGFTGVHPYKKVHPEAGFRNDDLLGWWAIGAAKGMNILMWRNRNDATGSSAPSAGSASPYKCIEYGPDDTLAQEFPARCLSPPNLMYWDVQLGLWLTEAGETPPT